MGCHLWGCTESDTTEVTDDYKDYIEHKNRQSSKLTQEEIEDWNRSVKRKNIELVIKMFPQRAQA